MTNEGCDFFLFVDYSKNKSNLFLRLGEDNEYE
jgi:hypothetical protein